MPYYAYVAELERDVAMHGKFRKRNPDMKSDLACLYVGQSVHTPEVRFKQHKEGATSVALS